MKNQPQKKAKDTMGKRMDRHSKSKNAPNDFVVIGRIEGDEALAAEMDLKGRIIPKLKVLRDRQRQSLKDSQNVVLR